MYAYILLELLLMAIINPVDGYYKFHFYSNDKVCEAGKFSGGVGFYLRHIDCVIYDTKTRLIVARMKAYDRREIRGSGWVNVHYNETMENKGFGMFVMIQRNGEERRSESPPSNYVIRKDTTEEKTPMPGTGNDFTSLWNGGPFIWSLRISDVKENGTEKTLKEYEPQKCAGTDIWFANEGYYKLEDDGTWTPVYYRPSEIDFYLFKRCFMPVCTDMKYSWHSSQKILKTGRKG